MKLQSELIIISDYFNFVRILKEINELGSRLEEVENAIVEIGQALKEFGVDSKCFIGADTTKLKNDLEIFEPNSEEFRINNFYG